MVEISDLVSLLVASTVLGRIFSEQVADLGLLFEQINLLRFDKVHKLAGRLAQIVRFEQLCKVAVVHDQILRLQDTVYFGQLVAVGDL